MGVMKIQQHKLANGMSLVHQSLVVVKYQSIASIPMVVVDYYVSAVFTWYVLDGVCVVNTLGKV